ncbi:MULTISPECIES: YbfB/YjiJ family MFS transporter [unclassified Psychrobacter]|uniref:YbfB/YjiJ family MFS transporter n=1 Tax=unclassified Psychrobacter TaxID=196806 RepID=UPI0018F735E0|nr:MULTISPECIES: YbfB/YjiJ family MFS transporter [unclassified Psychrobacter]
MPSSFRHFRITNELLLAWIGLYALTVVIGFGRFLFTATLPDMMQQLSMSTATAGFLASMNYIGYFIGAFVAMFVPQRLTWSMLMAWAVVSVVTTMLLSVPNMPLEAWYVIRLLAGMASGLTMIFSSTLVIQSFSAARRSVLSTLHYAGIGVGISASALLTWQLLHIGQHFDVIWLSAGVLSLPLLLLIYAIRPLEDNMASPRPRFSITQTYHNFKRALYQASVGHGRAIALLAFSYVLAGFGYITSATFLPVMAAQRLENAQSAGLMIWLVVGIFAMLSNPVWGALAKRIGETKTLMGLTAIQALGMFLPLWLPDAVGLYANAMILGLTFAGIVSMTLIIIKNINPEYSNLLMGLATVSYAFGQFVGPLVTVALAGAGDNFDAGLLTAGFALIISLLLVIWFWRVSSRHV